MTRFLCCVLVVLVQAQLTAEGQEKDKPKVEKKIVPRVVVVLPLGATPGATTKLVVRGINLEGAKEVKVADGKGSAKIIRKGKASVPDKNPEQVGDAQVEIELTLETKLPDGAVNLVLVTPDGDTKPHGVLITSSIPVLKEKEPNEGFRQAQEIKLPVMIEGSIDRPRDVDVFKFEGKAGQKVEFEVFAARNGSSLDSILTLYNDAGQQIATNDDQKETTDSRLALALPADGTYYLVLIDANDTGGPVHVYRLSAR